jgi:hypothetical protein
MKIFRFHYFLLMRKWIPAYAGMTCLLLAACGFKPIAATSTKSYENQQLGEAIASVNVQATGPVNAKLLGQNFRIALEDLINPGGMNSTGSAYGLEVSLDSLTQPNLIAPDGKAQRFLVYLNSTYTLTRYSDGKVLENGKLNRSGSYSNLPNSYYSTYIAEQDTIKRLTKELAEQYRMKLASILTAPPKEPTEILPDAPPILTRDQEGINRPFGQPIQRPY